MGAWRASIPTGLIQIQGMLVHEPPAPRGNPENRTRTCALRERRSSNELECHASH